MDKAKDHSIDYYQAAEYNTTIKSALDVIGVATPEQYLKFGLEQYLAGWGPILYFPNGEGGTLETMPPSHPDYASKAAEREQEIKSQLERAYKQREQQLTDELTTAQAKNPPEPRLLYADLLRESANRLLELYKNQLNRVRNGRRDESFKKPVMRFGRTGEPIPYSLIPKGIRTAGEGAAELAHFKKLLAEFHQAEQTPVDQFVADGGSNTTSDITLDPTKDLEMKNNQRRVALLHFYSQTAIVKRNTIAQQYGWSSAESLYNQYTYLSKTTNRIHSANKEKMIADIEAVLPYLSGQYLEQAKSDLKTIRSQK